MGEDGKLSDTSTASEGSDVFMNATPLSYPIDEAVDVATWIRIDVKDESLLIDIVEMNSSTGLTGGGNSPRIPTAIVLLRRLPYPFYGN
ncbi:unnamed protein product [Haemonchus placei]|uniref:Uncharacterized protein n=1 Tax=Haemonchus placei TaxID=6290 RepID=A0A3P7V837_HAEPC|nr:unnamed protein product [Haemonchus placei]